MWRPHLIHSVQWCYMDDNELCSRGLGYQTQITTLFFTLKKFNCWTIFSGADNLEELFILNKIQTENVTGSLSVTWYWYLEGRTARIHSSEYSSYNYRFQKKRNLIVDTMCIGNNFKWFFLSLHSIMETFHCYTIHFTCNFLF